MADFTTLQDRVNRRVIDLPAAVTAEVNTLINAAIRTLERRHEFKVNEAETVDLLTVADQRTLATAVASNYLRARGKPRLIEDGGGDKRMAWLSSRQAARDRFTDSDTTETGEPQYLLDPEPDEAGVRTFEVYPFSDSNSDYSDNEYRIVVPYWRTLAVLSADGDSNWFTTNAEEYIVAQATSEAFLLDWDEERAAVWATRANVHLQEVIGTDKLFRLGGVDTFVFSLDAAGPDR